MRQHLISNQLLEDNWARLFKVSRKVICNLQYCTRVNQSSPVAQSCQTLRNPMDCSTPGLPVHHQLPEPAQTHVHWVDDVIQPSHPLLSPSPPAFNPSQDQGLFQWVSSSHVSGGQSTGASAPVFPMNIQDWLPLGLYLNYQLNMKTK